MKTATFQNKYKLFPSATTAKKPTQQWNHLLKVSPQKKRLFKSKTRFFSLEYGRSLSKRLLWQIAQSKFKENNNLSLNLNRFHRTTDTKTAAKTAVCEKKQRSFFLTTLKLNTKLSYNWTIFRSMFFGKMWMLNNPALVPGVVWPMKSKKILVAKMRAFKTLTHLTGHGNLSFVLGQTQKLCTSQSLTKPSLWFFASSLDSLKANYLLKSGFVPTAATAHHWISYGNVIYNGFLDKNSMRFYYAGDFIHVTQENPLNILFNSGPRFQSLATCQKKGASIYTKNAFLWLSSFFKRKSCSVFKRKNSSLFHRKNPSFFKPKNSSFFKTQKIKHTKVVHSSQPMIPQKFDHWL